jgi:hypothetical protein
MLKAAHVFLCFCPIAIKGFWWGAKKATSIDWSRVLGLGDKCGRDLGVHHTTVQGSFFQHLNLPKMRPVTTPSKLNKNV